MKNSTTRLMDKTINVMCFKKCHHAMTSLRVVEPVRSPSIPVPQSCQMEYLFSVLSDGRIITTIHKFPMRCIISQLMFVFCYYKVTRCVQIHGLKIQNDNFSYGLDEFFTKVNEKVNMTVKQQQIGHAQLATKIRSYTY